MDAKTVIHAMLNQIKTSLKANEDESAQIQQQIAEMQQRLGALAAQHFTLHGKEQAYNEMLTVLEKTEAEPLPDKANPET